MRFVVPQFIDVEDKILGPLSVRQFVIFLVGAGLIFLAWKWSNFIVFAIEGVFIFAICGVFAFLKINGQPFHYFILNLLQTLRRPRLKIWYKELKVKEAIPTVKKRISPQEIIPTKEPLEKSRLSQLSLIVDTGGAYKPEESEE